MVILGRVGAGNLDVSLVGGLAESRWRGVVFCGIGGGDDGVILGDGVCEGWEEGAWVCLEGLGGKGGKSGDRGGRTRHERGDEEFGFEYAGLYGCGGPEALGGKEWGVIRKDGTEMRVKISN